MPSVKFLGTTDEVTTCEVCGKKNLKKTIAVSIDESDPIYMGSECATRKLGRSLKEVNTEVRKAEREQAEREAAERRRKWDEAQAPWFAYIRTFGKGDDDFTRIESLGGFKAAQEAFKRWQREQK